MPNRNERALSKNFKAWEFECRGENHKGFKCCGRSAPISPTLINKVQYLRSLVSTSLTINSGYRCNAYTVSKYMRNKSKATSSHCLGFACDIAIPEGYTSQSFFETIRETALFTRIGIYDTFIHVDVDPYKKPAIWDKRTRKKSNR